MAEILPYVMTLLMLTLLQAVLGFDNLLYISIESKRVEEDKQSSVRKWGIGLAIFLRIILLFIITKAIGYFQDEFWHVESKMVEFGLTGHALIVLLGGAFIIYTALKEISHMLADHDLSDDSSDNQKRSVATAVTWIVIMNLVFSFDSILSAIALASTPNPDPSIKAQVITTGGMIVMTLAIVFSGLMMIILADRVSNFLKENRLYEVLGLFVLFIVGIMLVSEGGHLAHLKLFGYAVEPMAKSTFYFVLIVLIVVDVVQGRYQKKLMAQRKSQEAIAESSAADVG